MTTEDDRAIRVWCGPDSPPFGEKSKYKIHLNSIPPNQNVYLKAWNISTRLASDLTAVSLDLLEIASYIYAVDQSRSRGGSTFPQDGKNWYRQFELNVPVRRLDLWDIDAVRSSITNLLKFMTDDEYQLHFRKLEGDFPREAYFDFEEGTPWFSPDSVLLFSGGLDSLTGLMEELQTTSNRIVLVSHCPVGKISKAQEELLADIREKFDASNRILHVPVWVNKEKGITRDANQRSRSFLYASIATVIASMTGTNEIKFYENGVVSCNLPISRQVIGARASRTTHPKTLNMMSQLYSLILGYDFKVSNPFFEFTKSDVVKKLKEHGGQSLIKHSRSCSHTMGSTRMITHCGTCSQCIERRLAVLLNRLETDDPAEMYATDLFLGQLSKLEDKTMVGEYVRHARRLEEIDEDSFFQEFPEVFRLVNASAMHAPKAGQLLFDLHKRHGSQVATVINSQIERQSDAIRTGQVPPNSLLGMIIGKTKKSHEPDAGLKRFPTPGGTKWEEIRIELVSNESVRIRVGEIVQRYTGFEMGFRDGRKLDRLNKQWELLTTFAYRSGVIASGVGEFMLRAPKSVQALKKTLQVFFSIDSSPIHRYSRRHGWHTRFRIEDKSHGRA